MSPSVPIPSLLRPLALAIGALLLVSLLTPVSPARGAGSGAGANSAAKEDPDVTAPVIFLRMRKRQAFSDALGKDGVEATCGTNERPVHCVISVRRHGKLLMRDSGDIFRPYNRRHFHLRPEGRVRRALARHGAPIEMIVRVRAVDQAGNVGKDRGRLRLQPDRG